LRGPPSRRSALEPPGGRPRCGRDEPSEPGRRDAAAASAPGRSRGVLLAARRPGFRRAGGAGELHALRSRRAAALADRRRVCRRPGDRHRLPRPARIPARDLHRVYPARPRRRDRHRGRLRLRAVRHRRHRRLSLRALANRMGAARPLLRSRPGDRCADRQSVLEPRADDRPSRRRRMARDRCRLRRHLSGAAGADVRHSRGRRHRDLLVRATRRRRPRRLPPPDRRT
jgi:hypothetical protein